MVFIVAQSVLTIRPAGVFWDLFVLTGAHPYYNGSRLLRLVEKVLIGSSIGFRMSSTGSALHQTKNFRKIMKNWPGNGPKSKGASLPFELVKLVEARWKCREKICKHKIVLRGDLHSESGGRVSHFQRSFWNLQFHLTNQVLVSN